MRIDEVEEQRVGKRRPVRLQRGLEARRFSHRAAAGDDSGVGVERAHQLGQVTREVAEVPLEGGAEHADVADVRGGGLVERRPETGPELPVKLEDGPSVVAFEPQLLDQL